MRVAALVSFLTILSTSPALAQGEMACLAADAPGIDPADMETVAQIVCSQLRRQGERIADAAPGDGAHWLVSARPLGRKVFLSLQEVSAQATVLREGEILLTEIEEVPVAAPRLVTAVLEGLEISRTATVDSLVGDEVRQRKKKDGEHFFGLGLMGLAVPGTDLYAGAGFILRWAFETPGFGVLSDIRFGGGRPGDDSAAFFSLGVGARWFLLQGGWSPFLGTGMAFTTFGVTEADEFDGSQAGLGAWLELGVEVLRLHESRLSLELRAEPVFYELEGWDELKDENERSYYLPVTFGLTYLF